MSLVKKLCSVSLSVVLVTGLLPYSAYADPASNTATTDRNEAAVQDLNDDGVAARPVDDGLDDGYTGSDPRSGTEIVYWGDDSNYGVDAGGSGSGDAGTSSSEATKPSTVSTQIDYSEGRLGIWEDGLDGASFESVYGSDASDVRAYANSSITPMAFSEEMTYFCKYESSCNYDQGLSSGDGYHAMGYFQFDNRYGLGRFLEDVYNYNPSKYWALAQIGELYDWDVYGNDGSTYYYLNDREYSLRDDLNWSWHQAYAADPTEFSELQNGWAYEEYYTGSMGAQGCLNAFGINLDNRPDCIKGLCWGMVNLFGVGGGASYVNNGKYYGANWFFKNSGINDSMSNEELVTTLCDFVVNNVAARYPKQSVYWQGWQNRYRSEKSDCLNYLGAYNYTIEKVSSSKSQTASVANGEYVVKSALANLTVLQASGQGSASGSALSINSSDMGWNQIFVFEKDGSSGLTRVKDKESGKYLSLASSKSMYSPNVVQKSYDANDETQLWLLEDEGDGLVSIFSYINNEYCLDVSGASTSSGTKVSLYESNGTDAQKWKLYSTSVSVQGGKTISDGVYTIALKGDTSKVLDISGASDSNGANVQVYSPNSTAAQKFKFVCGSDGFYTITNLKSGKALDVYSACVLPGANVQQWESNGTDAQKWAVRANSDGSYSLVNKANGLALDADGTASGSNVATWELRQDSTQQFNITSAKAERTLADGVYVLSSALNQSRVLDIAGGSGSNGASTQLYDSNMTAAQKFKFTYDEVTGFYKIQNVGSGKVLDATDGKIEAGIKIQQWESNDTLAQRWEVVSSGGTITIRSAVSPSYVFDLTNGASSNGAAVQLWESNGSNAQKFYAVSTAPSVMGGKTIDDGVYAISIKGSSSKVLDVADASESNGANVQVYSSNNTAAQKFKFVCGSDGFYTITNLKSGKVLDAADANLVPGTNVQQWESNETDAQKWAVRANSDGSYSLVNKANGLSLDAAGTSNGSNVQLWAADSSRAQSFSIQSVKPARTVADGTYLVSASANRGQVFDIAGGSASAGAKLQVYESNMTAAQSFRFVYDETTGYYTIANAGSGKALDAEDGYCNNGTRIQQWDANGTLAQCWEVVANGDCWTIRSAVDPSKVFDLANGSTSNSNAVQLWESNGTAAQKFYFVANEHEAVAQCDDLGLTDWYEIVPTSSSSVCFDIADGSKQSGAKVQLWNSNQTMAQLYKLEYSDGYYRIVSMASGKAVELKNGSIVPGVGAQQVSSAESGAQQFRIDANTDGSYTFTCVANGLKLAANSVNSGTVITGEIAENATACETFKLVKRDYALPEGLVEISTSLDGGKDLDVADGSDNSGANVQLWESNGTLAQKWQVKQVSGKANTYRFESAASGKYMGVKGTNVCQLGYDADAVEQMWMLVGIDAGACTFMNLKTNTVLDVSGASTANGSNIQTYAYNGTLAQKFNVKTTDVVQTGMFVLHSKANNNQVVDVANGSLDDCANVQSWSSNGTGAQKWNIEGNGDGTYRIVNAANGKALDVTNGSASAGANIQQYTWNGTNAQKWYATYQGGGGMTFESAANRSLVLSLSSNSPSDGTNLQLAKKDGSAAQRFTFESTTYTPPKPSDQQSMLDVMYWEDSSTEWAIGVDRSLHKVGVFHGWSGNWTLYYWWDCVTGAPASPTITGSYYTTGFKRDSLDTDSRAIYCTQIWGGYFFHSVLNSEEELGQSLSHGCLRMAWSTAEWIHDNINAGTKVLIYN